LLIDTNFAQILQSVFQRRKNVIVKIQSTHEHRKKEEYLQHFETANKVKFTQQSSAQKTLKMVQK
jgi:hypothetical protein